MQNKTGTVTEVNMAKITFSLKEIIEILDQNEQIHRDITDLRVEGETVHFKIKTGIPLVPLVPASATYENFEHNILTLRMHIQRVGSALAKKAVHWMTARHSEKIPPFITIDYPELYIDVKRAIDTNIKGVVVEDILHEDGHFTVTTRNV